MHSTTTEINVNACSLSRKKRVTREKNIMHTHSPKQKKFLVHERLKKKKRKKKTHAYTKLPTSSPSKVKWSTAKPNSAVVVTSDAKGSVVPDRNGIVAFSISNCFFYKPKRI